VNFSYAAVLMVTFVLGAWLGGKTAVKLNATAVRLVFSAFLFYVACSLAWKSIAELMGTKGS
jgi:uncharacterized membrane protein YfcA